MIKYTNNGKELTPEQENCLDQIETVLANCGYSSLDGYSQFFGYKTPLEALEKICREGDYGAVPSDIFLFA
jgi:hypothetical protein